LGTTEKTISQIGIVLEATRSSLDQLTGTVSDLNPLLETTREIIGDDLRGVIIATQDSLVTAEESAKNVDKLLFALDTISFLTGVTYDPDLTLSEGISGISEELEPLPEDFEDLAEGISSAGQNLVLLSTEISKIEQSLGNTDGVLLEIESAIGRAQTVSSGLETTFIEIQDKLTSWINSITAVIIAILLWMVIVQIGLFFQGSEMAGYSFAKNVPKYDEVEDRMLPQNESESPQTNS
jgi:hypothetical protein